MKLAALLTAVLELSRPGASTSGDAAVVLPAIVWVVEHEPAPRTWTAEEFATVLALGADRESRMQMRVHGDCEKDMVTGKRILPTCRAHCSLQVWGPAWLVDDPRSCVSSAAAVVRIAVDSRTICPDEPLAPYCGGCRSPRARAIARKWSSDSMRFLAAAKAATAE